MPLMYRVHWEREVDRWSVTFMDKKGQYTYPLMFHVEPTPEAIDFLMRDTVVRLGRLEEAEREKRG